MKPTRALTTQPTSPLFTRTSKFAPNVRWVPHCQQYDVRFPAASVSTPSTHNTPLPAHSSSPAIASGEFHQSPGKLQSLEGNIEKVIYGCRFFTILAVWGSLVGSFLCFIKGCTYIFASYQQYLVDRGKVILLLVEAIDVYLLGTVMLVFGMGLYELFISNLDIAKSLSQDRIPYRSNLFGLFTLKERPRWLAIKSVNELKTKLGHVIVMLLLIGLFDKSKKAIINSPTDLLCFSASVLLSSGCLYLLSKLNGSK
ncbi:hypothetical protein RJ639_007106 [Escallonia herrerae]|uniref:Uncharacterized protein n=1 Tax=Escallonia herrerae TaxID=1293975 RepID=A0AA88VVZ7_9ASTE|nr:hypothetical protein RJ639_007106 [Escallonia herrerae]